MLKYIVLTSIIPAKLARSLEPFDDPAWLFELKHDGFRSLAYIEDGNFRRRTAESLYSIEVCSHKN
jgi:hypothetical protein